jgi:hypothetical protein
MEARAVREHSVLVESGEEVRYCGGGCEVTSR